MRRRKTNARIVDEGQEIDQDERTDKNGLSAVRWSDSEYLILYKALVHELTAAEEPKLRTCQGDPGSSGPARHACRPIEVHRARACESP